jgi:N-methylhydantoinase A
MLLPSDALEQRRLNLESVKMIRVGVDVGGTFTDIVLEQTATGIGQKIFVHKVASTPSDQSVGVVQGIVEICRSAGVAPGDINMVLHGTTVAATSPTSG